MKRFFSHLVFTLISVYALSQTGLPGWKMQMDAQRFVENRSQFDGRNQRAGAPVEFGADESGMQVFFTKEGLTYRLDQFNRETPEEKAREREELHRKIRTAEEYEEYEKKERRNRMITELVHMSWKGSSAGVKILAQEQARDYFSYLKITGENINYVKSYKELLYKDLYPGIDVLYEFHPSGGIKYSVVVHPGADPAQVVMLYSGAKKISADKTGSLHIGTRFGDILDHAPLTFYADDRNSVIPSSFRIRGNEVSFQLGSYDRTRTVIIDPWTQAPTFPSTNWNCVWECERDAAGNVYIIGGTSPMQLKKYNSAGAIQWTYNTPYDTTEWLGTFATDAAGNSYIAQGSPARIHKVNNAAGVVWNNNNPGGIFSLTEFWNITFNCDQTRLIIGGTGGNFIPPRPYIYNVDMATGNITLSAQVAGSGGIGNDQEVRAVAPCKNGKYYFLSHDSIGYIHQSLNTCISTGGLPYHINSGADLSYKCENWRYNNSGIMALAYYNGFIFMHRGNQLQKRDANTAAILGTVAIPGGTYTGGFGGNQVGCSGIDVDTCGNVFVGSTNGVYKFSSNLVQLASYATTYNVYDVEVSTAGDVIACGSTGNSGSGSRTGSVQSFAAAACQPTSLSCCDATICNSGPFCDTDPPQNLTSAVSGGTWSGTGITNTSTGVFDPSVSGTGTFTITYNLPCGKDSMQVVVQICATPTVCLEPNGDLTASGGVAPYHWDVQGTAQSCASCLFPALCQPPAPNCPLTTTVWTTYSTSTTATPPGTWPIRLVDANGNTLVISSLAGIQPCSNLSTSQTNVTCFGQCTGSATVTPTSGSPPYTFSWNTTPVQTTQTATGLCAGTYSVSVTDASPNTTSAVVTITQPNSAVAATATVTAASCSGPGSASVTGSGGSPAYTYSWSNGQTTQTATGLTAGNYTATVTDAGGCTATATVSINSASGGTVSVNSASILCNGDSAVLNATMSGGTSPFTYNWSGGQSTSSVNVPAGSYTITVTDVNGCTSTQTVSLTQPAALTSSVTSVNTTCGATAGSASVSVSGGSPGYTYSWSNGSSASAISSLGAGTYSCTITDANGCTQVQSAVIANANGPTASIASSSTVTCNGGSNGTAGASATGGTSPYTYVWSNGQSAQNATGLSAGTYTVIVTDATGCTNTQTVSITQPAALSASVSTTASLCGQTNGSATVNASGGTSPYTYSWSGGQSAATATGLGAGSYSVTVTDANGCTSSYTATVTNSNGPTALAGATATIVLGSSAQLSSSGGVTYSWSPATGLSNPNIANPVATPSVTTVYCVFVTDANNCSDSACITITVEAPCNETWYLPNAFSPNDDGENDQLKVYLPDPACVTEFRLQVFDRWGEMVFESIDPLQGWNGMFDNRFMNTQVLAWNIRIVFTSGTLVEKKGNVSLMR